MKLYFYQHNKKLRWFILFLLLSIILHIIFCFFFLEHGFKAKALKAWQSLTEKFSTEERKQQHLERIKRQEKIVKGLQTLMGKNDHPAKLTAKKSKFGWVLFDTPPQQSNNVAMIPTTMEGPVMEAMVDMATEVEKTVIDEKIAMDESPVLAQAENQDRDSSALKDSTSPGDVLPAPTTLSTQERIKCIQALEQQLAAAVAPSGKKAAIATQIVRGAYSEQKKPTRNIIALTKGFIEKWDGEDGDDLIDRDGDPNKRPSFEELKYIHYESKLSWCLQASWKQNFERNASFKRLPDGEAYIEFTIDQHGKLQQQNLLQSTGNTQLDDMIMKSLKFASPFPPIPKHFNLTNYTTGRHIHVYAHRYNF